jgi:hypothetical protein
MTIGPSGQRIGERKQRSFRDAIRRRTGMNGEKLWEILVDIAEGKAWVPRMVKEDGTVVMCEPQVPTTSDRVRAAQLVAEHLVGKPVPETEIVRAEGATQELAAIRQLSDAELERRVRAIAVSQMTAGSVEAVLLAPEPEPLGLPADAGQVRELATEQKAPERRRSGLFGT